jgi:gliding motility-associated-like protein
LGLLLLFTIGLSAQDFSNKGKDFWVGYGYHVRMNGGNGGSQQMVLYFATESVTNVSVSIPGLGYQVTYANIPANSIFTSNPIPKAGTQDARLTTEGISDKGIHITSDKPIVAYAHIYDGNVSGATLLFPTNTLGREYYSVNSTQISNENRSNGWFYAVAVDTGTTVVEIVPSANTLARPAGIPFTVSLKQGQIVNFMGELLSTSADPYTGVDLTGSTIRSVSSGTGGCKRIGVFSGSGKISLTCNNGSSSADNYIVQALPKNAWGKRYLTAPTRNFPNNFFRVCVTDPSTVVRFNGAVLTNLQRNFFYDFNTSEPGLIEADKPVMVAQYITSQSACGNGNPGDPEVIYLSPVEQNIDRVILNSTPNFAITRHFINVVIRSSAVGSFRLDGTAVTGFQTHPRDQAYAYAMLEVSAGNHTLQADSGFNAIAYGYGVAESYGYNAGTNVKDLYQFASVKNQYATVNFPAACKSSPFQFSMTFPYRPAQIKWVFGPALNGMGLADVTVSSPQFDSTWVVNDKQLYRYKLPDTYVIPAVGTYPIRIFAQNTTPEGCSGEQEIDYDLQVFERPVASFTVQSSGCVSDSVRFTDNSNLDGRQPILWAWNFGDSKSAGIRNPAHLYAAAGSYGVKYFLVSDIGCISDTATRTVVISDPPVAKFGVSGPGCSGKALTFTDSSTAASGNIAKWTWDFGDNSAKVVATTGAPQAHTYANTGDYTVTLQVENSSGCKSIAFSRQLAIGASPTVNFIFGNGCLPAASVQFTNQSTITGSTGNPLSYNWSFGEGSTSIQKDPMHTYNASGPFSTTLVVTAASGCKDSLTKTVNTIFSQPLAAFDAPAERCPGAAFQFTNQSTALNSSVTAWEWNFGDGSAGSSQQNPTYSYTTTGTYTVSLRVTSAVGCVSAVATKTVIVNAKPVAGFTVPGNRCETGLLTFTNTSTTGTGIVNKWSWNFGDGGAVSSQASPSYTYQKAGAYNVTLQVETDKGCVSDVLTRQVSVHPLPKVGFIVPGNCINDPISSFIDTSSIADGSQAQFSWLWNFGDGNALPGNNSSNVQNGQHRYTATGTYNVSLQVTSKDGCRSSLTQPFTVNGAVPVPQFTFQRSTQICSNDSLVVTDNSNVTPGSLVKLEIFWDYAGNPADITVVDKPARGAIYRHTYPEFFTPATKTFRVRMVVYSGINCLTVKDTTITVLAAPAIRFNPVQPVCASQASFQLAAEATNMTGTGTYSGRGTSAAGLFNPEAAGQGSHVIRYTFTGTNGCRTASEQTVLVFPVPIVSAGPDKFILEGGSTVLNGSGAGNTVSYQWSPVTALNNATLAQPVAMPVEDITYTLTVTSVDGCSAADQVTVKVLKSPSVPNAFSPNGDGVHDRWEIQYLDSYPGAIIEVFNRYGQKVFESKGYTKPWDGTANGKPLPVGTYYYLIDPKNGRKPISGFVDIIR